MSRSIAEDPRLRFIRHIREELCYGDEGEVGKRSRVLKDQLTSASQRLCALSQHLLATALLAADRMMPAHNLTPRDRRRPSWLLTARPVASQG
jgi:hypothetical protein